MAELPNQQKYLFHRQVHWRNSPAENHLLSSPLPLEHLFRSFTLEFKKVAQKFAGSGRTRQRTPYRQKMCSLTQQGNIDSEYTARLPCLIFKVVFCWNPMLVCSPTVLACNCTAGTGFCTLLSCWPKLPITVNPETIESWIRSLNESERNSKYHNIFMDQCGIKELEIRQLQRSRGKLYGFKHSYRITFLQSLISGWGRAGEKWVANFSKPQLSSSLKETLFKVCLFLIKKKAFCINLSAFL